MSSPTDDWNVLFRKFLVKAPIFAVFGFLLYCSTLQELSTNRTPSSQPNTRNLKTGQPKFRPLVRNYDIKKADPSVNINWGIKNTASKNAWERVTEGSRDIVVAVIDTGLDLKHHDLRDNLWVNKGEIGLDRNNQDKRNNQIDDDDNGFIDDVHGWNFVNNNNHPQDTHGHGTHVAGIVGAVGSNGVGISGISPRVSLMALKYYHDGNTEENHLENTIKSIEYAINNGAHIINYSGGGPSANTREKALIKQALDKNILFVAAAGNKQEADAVGPYYPANYLLANIISVAAISKNINVLKTSNSGQFNVDIAAPGHNIYSTLLRNQYGFMTGTSQATPFVSGVAALIKAKFPDFTPQQIIEHILNNGDKSKSLDKKTKYATKLNTYKALTNLGAGVSANGAVVRDVSVQFLSDPKDKTIQPINPMKGLLDSIKNSK